MPEQEKAPAEKARVVVRVRVLKGGITIGGSTAARGAVVKCYADVADFHEKRGEVRVEGTAADKG